jgi:hypothetical protein
MPSHRQRRLRVLEELERRAKQFRTDEDLYPLRVPREPLPLDEVIDQALPGGEGRVDPLALRSRTLLELTWDDGSRWEVWVLMLPSGLKLFCDSGSEEARVLASGGRFASDETDRQFLRLLSESGGERFGLELHGDAPSGVRSSIADRETLIDMFVDLFEVAHMEPAVRRYLERAGPPVQDSARRGDFRADVEHWLDRTLRAGG